MASFLDQDEIDRLQYELLNIGVKKEKAQNAVDSIKEMYYDTVKMPLYSTLGSLEEIGECIDKLSQHIVLTSKYYEAYMRLKTSYLRRV